MQATINIHRTSLMQVTIVIGAVLGWGFYFFDDEIKAWWGRQGADVGKKLLSDESLQRQAEELGKALAERVLTDKAMEDLAVRFVGQVLEGLANDPVVMDRAVDFLQRVMAQPTTQRAFQNLVVYGLNHPQTVAVGSAFFTNLLASPAFKESSSNLGAYVAHTVLDDPAVKQHTNLFLSQILNDKKVQSDTGELLWSAIWHAVTPSLRVFSSKKADEIAKSAK